MKLFITGASGFIGRTLVKELKPHSLTFGIRSGSAARHFNDGFPCIELDKLSAGDLKSYYAVVHLAGLAHKMKDHANSSKREYIKVNSELTLKLAKTALKAGVRTFIYASSVKVMGEGAPKMEPLTEEAPFSPENSYAMSKMEAEKELAKLFGKQTDSRVVIFRLPMVYGPGNKGNMLALLKMASRGIPLPLGALKAKRSMIYIGNLCDAIRKVIEDDKKSRPSVQTYFINDGDDISSRELYAMISREYSGKDGLFYLQPSIIRFIGIVGSMLEKGTGLKLQVNREVVSKLINEYRFSAAAFCQDYDWSPPHTVHDGIKATVEWHRNNSGIGGPA